MRMKFLFLLVVVLLNFGELFGQNCEYIFANTKVPIVGKCYIKKLDCGDLFSSEIEVVSYDTIRRFFNIDFDQVALRVVFSDMQSSRPGIATYFRPKKFNSKARTFQFKLGEALEFPLTSSQDIPSYLFSGNRIKFADSIKKHFLATDSILVEVNVSFIDKTHPGRMEGYLEPAIGVLKIYRNSPLKQNERLPEKIYKNFSTSIEKLNDELKRLNAAIPKLSKDYEYASIDFTKVDKAHFSLSILNSLIENRSTEEFALANFLLDDLMRASKVLRNKKRFRKDKLFFLKYQYLMENIEAMTNFMMNPSLSGHNVQVSGEKYCILGKIPFSSIYSPIANENTSCGGNGKYPVRIYAVSLDSQKNKIQVNNLSVYYKYSFEMIEDKSHFMQFGKLTSPSCEMLYPGIWDIWLVDEFSKQKENISEKRQVRLINKEYIGEIPIEIPVNK